MNIFFGLKELKEITYNSSCHLQKRRKIINSSQTNDKQVKKWLSITINHPNLRININGMFCVNQKILFLRCKLIVDSWFLVKKIKTTKILFEFKNVY